MRTVGNFAMRFELNHFELWKFSKASVLDQVWWIPFDKKVRDPSLQLIPQNALRSYMWHTLFGLYRSTGACKSENLSLRCWWCMPWGLRYATCASPSAPVPARTRSSKKVLEHVSRTLIDLSILADWLTFVSEPQPPANRFQDLNLHCVSKRKTREHDALTHFRAYQDAWGCRLSQVPTICPMNLDNCIMPPHRCPDDS